MKNLLFIKPYTFQSQIQKSIQPKDETNSIYYYEKSMDICDELLTLLVEIDGGQDNR